MQLRILQGNVLDAKADSIILTIDGAAKGMEGNIARAFARRWPDVWVEVENEIIYPLPLGEVYEVEPSAESPFQLILIASTLNHKDTLSEVNKKSVVRTALEASVNIANRFNLRTIASGIMVGGWRLSQTSAFVAMTEGYEATLKNDGDVDLDIYVLDQGHYETIQNLARGLGWI